jgi:D-aminoacyl-tRNA deacylase
VITLVQRVLAARVLVDGIVVGEIARGLCALVGVEVNDTTDDADATARKLAALRVFPDRTPTDASVLDIGGGCLVVSQFTLAAELRHGNRPDFTAAAKPEVAEPLYLRVAEQLRAAGIATATGRFGAAMQVELTNDGPFTLVLTVRNGRVIGREPASAT